MTVEDAATVQVFFSEVGIMIVQSQYDVLSGNLLDVELSGMVFLHVSFQALLVDFVVIDVGIETKEAFHMVLEILSCESGSEHLCWELVCLIKL